MRGNDFDRGKLGNTYGLPVRRRENNSAAPLLALCRARRVTRRNGGAAGVSSAGGSVFSPPGGRPQANQLGREMGKKKPKASGDDKQAQLEKRVAALERWVRALQKRLVGVPELKFVAREVREMISVAKIQAQKKGLI